MEGSPVRGQQKVPVAYLNESLNVENFQAEIVHLLNLEFKHAQVLFSVVDPDSGTLQWPMWIQSLLERHPGLDKKLELGEMVGASSGDQNTFPRAVAPAPRSSVVLIPLIAEAKLIAAIGLVSPLDQPPLSAEDIEFARQLAYDSTPILARLRELQKLQRENQELHAKLKITERSEEEIAGIIEQRNALDATLQMRSHQQINLAHELRTPLAAIRGYARMILDGRGGPINEKQKEYLQVVTDNTHRLITLVAWMGYVGELSAQHLKLSRFDFRDIWTECIDGSQGKLAEKSLKLNQRIADEAFTIIGDSAKLTYALNELTSVALKLADDGGTITAELSHGRDGEVSFKLSSTGGHIPTEVLSKIFDRPFNNFGKPVTQNTPTVGISLSGVYDVVGMHGGRVFVNSSAGKGTTFLFTLPAVSAGGEENSHEQAVNFSRRR